MCGIVGYIGRRKALSIVVDGLRRLEYRGYDSAGVAVLGEKIEVIKEEGKIENLVNQIPESFAKNNTIAIGHTRWATHGIPNKINAHPHVDGSGTLALVHNGIFENYNEIKNLLIREGHQFKSETDSEVLVHLIEYTLKQNPEADLAEGVRLALKQVRGTYGIAVISTKYPDKIVVARLGSPIVLGVKDDEFFVASDPNAILSHTRKMIFLDDGEMAVLNRNGYSISSLDKQSLHKPVEEIDWTAEMAQKNGQPHFMLKEILEQPEVITNSIRGRLNVENGTAVLGGLSDVAEKLRSIDRLIIVACGSAYYAGLVGEYMLEEFAHISVEVELASEFRYRKQPLLGNAAVLAVSQSGETADTLAAIREAKRRGLLTLGIVNAVGSTIARETDAGVYNHAGPEIGVASTKAFVSQCVVLALLTLFLGRQRGMSEIEGQAIAKSLQKLPELVQKILDNRENIKSVAEKYGVSKNILYIGRKYTAPIACEGALKLKEISYIHAEAYPAGELKHGSIALVDKDMPVVAICPMDSVYEKTRSNIEEIRARSGRIIALVSEGDTDVAKMSEDSIYVPKTIEMLGSIVTVVPLQLFAYYVATAKQFDPDKPRNLAKSVTVE